jgi:hypothetical protein
MGSYTFPAPKKKLFTDPDYLGIPEQQPADLIPSAPEPSIAELMKSVASTPNYLMNPWELDELQNKSYMAVDQGPPPVAVPKELQPIGVKEALKRKALSMIPIYGQAYEQAESSRRAYAASQYQSEVARQQEVYKQQAQMKQQFVQESMKRQHDEQERMFRVRALQTLYGGSTPGMQYQAITGSKMDEPISKNIRIVSATSPVPITASQTPDGMVHWFENGQVQMGLAGQDPRILKVLPETSVTELNDPTGEKWRSYQTSLGQLPANASPEMRAALSRMYGVEDKANRGTLDQQMADLELKAKMGPLSPDESAYLNVLREMHKKDIPVVGVTTTNAQGQKITKFVPKIAGTEFAGYQNNSAWSGRIDTLMGQMQKLSMKLITGKSSIEQRAKSAGLSVSAFIANEPEFKTYQRFKGVLGQMLAREVEGGRMTDADRQVQLDSLPDVTSDTVDSAKMAWEFLNSMRKQGVGSDKIEVGDIIEQDGQQLEVIGFDGSGNPQAKPVRKGK